MLGHAAGGGEFSSKNWSTRFGSAQTGYPLTFPCNEIRDTIKYMVVVNFFEVLEGWLCNVLTH